MTGLARSATRGVRKIIPKEVRKALPKEDLTRKTEAAVLKTHFSPRIPSVEQPVIPLPDEDALRLQAKRRSSRRSGGRAATVLTGGEYDPVG